MHACTQVYVSLSLSLSRSLSVSLINICRYLRAGVKQTDLVPFFTISAKLLRSLLCGPCRWWSHGFCTAAAARKHSGHEVGQTSKYEAQRIVCSLRVRGCAARKYPSSSQEQGALQLHDPVNRYLPYWTQDSGDPRSQAPGLGFAVTHMLLPRPFSKGSLHAASCTPDLRNRASAVFECAHARPNQVESTNHCKMLFAGFVRTAAVCTRFVRSLCSTSSLSSLATPSA